MRSIARCLIFAVVLPLVTASPQSASAQNAPDLVKFLPDEAAGWKAAGADRVFTRQTAAAYLGKAGELYLAYGFRRLLVREYRTADGAPLVAEIYDMTAAADAFGVFANDPDGEGAAVGNEARYGRGLLRFWKGPFFVRLLARRQTAATRGQLTGLGRAIAAAIPEGGARPAIVACLPQDGLEERSVRYFHKQVSLDSQYYLADENALRLDEGTEAALGRYREARGESMLLLCRYRTPADARRAFLEFSRVYFSGKIDERQESVMERIENGQFAAALPAGPCLVIVLESPERPACEALAAAAASRVRQAFARKSQGRK